MTQKAFRNIASQTDFSHHIVKQFVSTGDIAIDATVGNGYDTIFLASLIGDSGKIFGFDINSDAIRRTKEKLQAKNIHNVKLITESHSKIDSFDIPESKVIMFNLGYLPNSDHQIRTSKDTTLQAIQKGLALLSTNGIMSIIAYRGHDGGEEEYQSILDYLKDLNTKLFTVKRVESFNTDKPAPVLLLVVKK